MLQYNSQIFSSSSDLVPSTQLITVDWFSHLYTTIVMGEPGNEAIVVIEYMTHDSCATHFWTRCQGSKVINLLVEEDLPCHYRLQIDRLVSSTSVIEHARESPRCKQLIMT